MFYELGFDNAINLLYVTPVQRNKDCLLIRKILINRADTCPGHLGNAVRGDSAESLTLQHFYNRVEYRVDGLARPPLLRPPGPG